MIKKRRPKPPQGLDYKKYKPYLRKEFNYSCGYCGGREAELGGAENFHVDHYRPQCESFAGLHKYSNLIYACRKCNVFKGPYWPSLLQRLQNHIILNPCKDDFGVHLNRKQPEWKHRTEQGKFNLIKLRLSSPEKVKMRADRAKIEEIIKKFSLDLRRSEELMSSGGQLPDSFEALRQECKNTHEYIETLTRKISGPHD